MKKSEAVQHDWEISNAGGKNWIFPKMENGKWKMETVSSEALIGCKSGKTTYVPL
jgi:hypothetical protein